MASSSENGIEKDLQILGLSAGASPAEVKKAYRELVKRWHPDRFHSQSPMERRQADEKIKNITGAYQRISREWANQKKAQTEEARAEETAQPGETARPAPGKPSEAETSAPKREAARPESRPHSFFRSLRLRFASSFRGKPLKQKLVAAGVFAAVFAVLLGVTNLLTRLPLRFWGDSGTAIPEGSSHLNRKPPWEDPGEKPPSEEPPAPAEEETEAPPSGTAWSRPAAAPDGQPRFVLFHPWDQLRRMCSAFRARRRAFTDRSGRTGSPRCSSKTAASPDITTSTVPSRFASCRIPPPKSRRRATLPSVLLKTMFSSPRGPPTRIDAGKWHYGFGEIQFKAGRVQGYQNFYGNLRVLMLPATASPPAAARGYFTVGASTDDVLALQGTPTSVQGNLWRYESSTVLFRDGKVLNAVNSDANLRFLPPEDLKGRGKESG